MTDFDLHTKLANVVVAGMSQDDLIEKARNDLENEYQYNFESIISDIMDNLDAVLESEIDLVKLAIEDGARIVQATEPEVYGRWDWITDDQASDMSFDSDVNAAINYLATMYADWMLDTK